MSRLYTMRREDDKAYSFVDIIPIWLTAETKSIPDPQILRKLPEYSKLQYLWGAEGSSRKSSGKVKVKAALFWTPSLTAVAAELPS